jgi:membrane-associated protein
VPIVRTVATVMAGVGRMRFSAYAIASVLGGIVWVDGILLIGYWLGHIEFVQSHKGWIDYLVIAVVVLSLIPAGLHYLRGRRTSTVAD